MDNTKTIFEGVKVWFDNERRKSILADMWAARIGPYPKHLNPRGYGEIRTAMPFVDVLTYSHYPKHGNVAERFED